MEFTRIFRAPNSLGRVRVTLSTAAFGRRNDSRDGADIYDTAAGRAKILRRFFGSHQQPEDIQIVKPVEVFVGNIFERQKFVHSGVVYENIQLAVSLLGFLKQALHIFLIRNVSLNGDGFAACAVISLTTRSAPSLLEE